MSLIISDYAKRENSDGEVFFALILMGELETVKSAISGKYYLTSRKTSIPSTFPEQVCKNLIGTSIPGIIVKIDCEEYEFTIDSGEIITLSHRYEYQPEDSMEDAVFERKNGAEKPALV
ncbi:MAG: hypothetical protein JJU37_16280 [Balneolaceae bacterium]|nr:hypothetical protein [Balneolaceae bacterium]